MQKIMLNLTGDLDDLQQGIACILPELNLTLSPEGIPVCVEKGDHLAVSLEEKSGRLVYGERVQFFRGLSLLSQFGVGCRVEEQPCFTKNGVMFDASRNAVPTVDNLRFYFRKMALMGLNLGMMYTEDTYEVPSQPYFGYLRGKYTQRELKELDDYAFALGIELVPCIQTLGHLERVLHWNAMRELRDTFTVLMVGKEKTYDFLEQLIVNASAPYRSRRIHVGMDEAWDLGLGQYRLQNGYRDGNAIMKEHLERISVILKKHGLKPMMWSDMYFRIASSQDDYYDMEAQIPQEVVDSAPADIELVYWDYYHHEEKIYHEMLRRHQRFAAPTIFAGGVWLWSGPSANYDTTLSATLPALKQCKEMGIKEVFATAWGDNGAECNLQAVLYGMQLYAEYGYTGDYREDWVKARFAACVGADAQAFLDLSRFDTIPGVQPPNRLPANPSKYLLYEDALLPLFTADVPGEGLAEYYARLSQDYVAYREENPAFALFFDFYAKLGDVLSKKCAWRCEASRVVREGDRRAAAALAATVPGLIASVRALKDVWRSLWHSTNKPNGFEVIDIRLGGILARLETAQLRMQEFAEGRIADLPELLEERLPLFRQEDGQPGRCEKWEEIVSASKI